MSQLWLRSTSTVRDEVRNPVYVNVFLCPLWVELELFHYAPLFSASHTRLYFWSKRADIFALVIL